MYKLMATEKQAVSFTQELQSVEFPQCFMQNVQDLFMPPTSRAVHPPGEHVEQMGF